MPGVGHNSIIPKELLAYIEKLERLNDERKAVSEAITDVMTEAKASGFEVKMIREVLKLRKMERSDLVAHEDMRDAYISALNLV